jgi:hypothetical protein
MPVFLSKTEVTIKYRGLTEEEDSRLMKLCWEITKREMLEAGLIEQKGDMISLTEKGRRKKR